MRTSKRFRYIPLPPLVKETIAMPKPAALTALSNAEIDAETAAIKACWEQLKPLDNHARTRVIEWLHAWRRTEGQVSDDD